MIPSLLDLADQHVTIRNLLVAAFMAAQDLGEPDKRGGMTTLLQLATEKLRDAEAALEQLRGLDRVTNKG